MKEIEDRIGFYQQLYSEGLYLIDPPFVSSNISENDRGQGHGRNSTDAIVDIQTSEIEANAKYHGNGIVPVAVVLADGMSPVEELFLSKVLLAVNVRLEDTYLIYETEWPIGDFLVDKELSIEKVLCFGVEKSNVAGNMADYVSVDIKGKSCLFCDGLGKIEGDVALKKLLWKQLKQMF